jgi:tRNA threonylcarbamoyladenosine biosynthesis protein TsaB
LKLIAVETSTDACSAALFIDGEIREKFAVAPREHTKLILHMIDDLMAEAQLVPSQLDVVALSRGPGSFTGVRIASGVAHGIALGIDVPVAMVSTLASMAQTLFNRDDEANLAYTALDARMSEIFWGVYRRSALGLAELVDEETVTAPTHVSACEQLGHGIGSGWRTYRESLLARLSPWVQDIDDDVWPRATCIAQIGAYEFVQGRAVAVEQAMPVYLRDKVAKKKAER